jgi:hypothetical protein
MNTATTVIKSRWGFHPCDYEFFLKLKRLHKWYWQTVYDFHRWHRWWRKEPQNRTGPEPSYCRAFVEDKIWRKPVRMHGEDGFRLYPKSVVDRGVVSLYQAARMPQAEPVQPFDTETRAAIESLYDKVSPHFDE